MGTWGRLNLGDTNGNLKVSTAGRARWIFNFPSFSALFSFSTAVHRASNEHLPGTQVGMGWQESFLSIMHLSSSQSSTVDFLK